MAQLRRPPRAATDPRRAAPLFGALASVRGVLPCAKSNCPSHDGVRCEYVDRRGRRCAGAWCPEHRVVREAQVLCPRHARVAHALPGAGESAVGGGTEPAAALVSWVADGIDAGVRELLAAGGGPSVLTQPVLLTVAGADRRRMWERAWYIGSSGARGPRRVAVAVSEARQDELILRVDGIDSARFSPPWTGGAEDGNGQRIRVEFINRVLTALGVLLHPGGGTDQSDLYSVEGSASSTAGARCT